MLKVAFITPSLHVGGAERWLISLARNLINCETVGIALTNDFYDPATLRAAACFAPVHRPRRETDELKDIVEAACQHADVVISWGEHRLLELRAGLDCPVVDVSHSDGAWEASRELLHASCKGADYHAAVSVTAVSAFPEGVRRDVVAIPNGVEVDRIVPRRGRDVQRKQWGIETDCKIALFLGRFHKVKGPHLLIDALQFMPRNWAVAFIGHGPDEMEVKLHAATEAPGRCMFSSPIAHPGDAFAAADVVALPSQSE